MIKAVRCYWCDRLIRSPAKRKRITLMGPAAHRVYEHLAACPPDLPRLANRRLRPPS